MKLLIGDKEVEFTKKQLDEMYIDEGNEAEVFRYQDEVLKIYKDHCKKLRLDDEEALELSHIPTKRVLLPRRLLRLPETFSFKGYTTKYIENLPVDIIPCIKMEHFLGELELLEDDMEILADREVNVCDLNLNNMLYDGSMYFCDPGSFTFVWGSKAGEIHRNNLSELNSFVLDKLFGLIRVSGHKREIYKSSYDRSECLSSQIRENTVSGETVKQYVKRVTR